ncbi:MAG: DNA translocase FtsK 4TM domain-containing protein, partial [Candidatus Saccharimonadales bacterium]
MAKKKTKKSKKQQDLLSASAVNEIVAILLLAIAVLLVVAFLSGGGFLVEALFNGLKFLFGNVVYIVPLLLLYVAGRIFWAEKHPFSWVLYAGLSLFLISLTALFHIAVPPEDTLALAKNGSGGGMLGYALDRGLLSLLNQVTGSIVLLATLVISVVLMANTALKDLLAWLKERFASSEEDLSGQLATLKDATSRTTVNAQVPLMSGKKNEGFSGEAKEAEEENVLTTHTDPNWEYPPLDLLEKGQSKADAGDYKNNAEIIKSTLNSFNIKVEVEEINIGPTVTQYAIRPPSNVKLSKITDLERNLALSLAVPSLRIEAPIPGKSAVGIEVPNNKAAVVRMHELMQTSEWQKSKTPLNFMLGQGVAGQTMLADLANMPHALIAGATGSGKSVMINSFLLGLLYRNSPADLKLILVDPKRVELNLYDGIGHLLAPVITEPEKCISALKWAVAEMERRYNEFVEVGKRNIAEYNAVKKEERMPYIVIVIDELADLMMLAAQDVEALIVRLAQKSRATGIHLVLATQRPSVNVITGLIKANIPARIAFSTVSQVDSRTILDQGGAEKLLGNGDMLFSSPAFIKPKRIQGVYVSEKEVTAVTKYLREKSDPDYNEEVLTQKVRVG